MHDDAAQAPGREHRSLLVHWTGYARCYVPLRPVMVAPNSSEPVANRWQTSLAPPMDSTSFAVGCACRRWPRSGRAEFGTGKSASAKPIFPSKSDVLWKITSRDANSRDNAVTAGMAGTGSQLPKIHNPVGGQELPSGFGSMHEQSKARPVGFEPTTFGFVQSRNTILPIGKCKVLVPGADRPPPATPRRGRHCQRDDKLARRAPRLLESPGALPVQL